ncbi:hypothetical protein BGZ95_009779 [Linnemannia exigua]|uniref:Uncharacterized protein n=1 Tax=Linnemannia exigua TaxID=604196 RepID=A0AAD4DC79_9FUNG|nr:hypothetical protein BGZ95_009779 [Linnemannia exigua]
MSQPSNPATAYFKAAVKVLRLQRALSRSKSSKSSKDSTSPANSTQCSPTTSSFQHTNGKRVSYLHYHNHNHHNQSHHGHHGHHYRSESFDTPLYTLQRRRHTNGSHNHTTVISSTGQHSSAASVSHKHACKEVILYSSALPSTSKKHSRRSASPATFPVLSIHHSQQQQQQKHQQQSSASSLSRSKSMPNRRWKRASHQVVIVPQHLDIWVAGLASSSSAYESNACLPRRSLSLRSRASTVSMISAPPSPTLSPQQEFEVEENKNREETTLPDTCEGVDQEGVLDRAFEHIPNPTVSDSGPTRINATSAALQRANAFKAPMVSQQAGEQDQQDEAEGLGEIPTGGSPRKTVPGSRPSRSFTGSSLNSARSVFSTAMPLADSSMSIQSQRSESSLLSAVISAGGLPTMDVMMDQVDRSIAADSQAQLVENAHVGLACVSVVDRNLLAEPCSAEIETWVS